MKYSLLALFMVSTYSFANEQAEPISETTDQANQQRGKAREVVEPYGFLYGFGLGLSREIYQGFDRRVIPLPILGYRSEKLEVYGPFVSYDVFEAKAVEFSVKLAPRFQGTDEDDSDVFIGMDERKFSMDLGVGVSYQKQNWKTTASAMFDVLGRSDGYELEFQVGRVFGYGPVFVEPSISVSYLDDKHVDYYYGVREYEVAENRGFYQGKSAVNTAVGISVSTPIFFGGFTQLALDYTWYDSSITDSPIVEDDTNLSLRFLFSKMF